MSILYPFDENKALQLLSQLGLDDAAVSQKHANEYSGGMKRRLAIARALYGCTRVSELFPGEPILLIMDEPFKGLDSELKDKVNPHGQRSVRNNSRCPSSGNT